MTRLVKRARLASPAARWYLPPVPSRLVVTTVLVTLAAGPASAADSEATAVIRKLNATLVGVLHDAATLGYEGRAKRLAPAVNDAYDVPFMAEKSLGQGWKKLGEADRARWIDLSREFSVANYAANFDHDAGQTIELTGEEPSTNDTVIVHTRIVDPKAEPVDMSYRLHHTDAGWRIIDVLLKGTVSQLALQRSDYTSVLERQGFDALVATMQARITDLAAGRAKRKSA